MNVAAMAQPLLVMGYGQSDTHALTISTPDGDKPNPHLSAGHDYQTITGQKIAAMASKPDCQPKSDAPWFIGSTYAASDARSHEAQREHGKFHVLPVDVDKGGPSLQQVATATESIVGFEPSYIIYSSSSATADNPKWRVLFFLDQPVSGADYKEVQDALFDLYEAEGITCDRALSRTGQLVFLPNVPPEKRGEDGKPRFYEYRVHRGKKMRLDENSKIEQRRRAIHAAVEDAKREAQQRRAKAQAKREDDIGDSPVEVFNARHDLLNLMEKYGYSQLGRSVHWQSPLQSSGSHAVRVYDEQTWVSLSGSDMAAGIGSVGEYCCWGDAFDLFVHYEHSGDYTAAVRAYGREIDPPTVSDPSEPITGTLEEDFGAPELPEDATDVEEAADAPVEGTSLLKQWVFMSGDNEFYHVPTGRCMGVTAFNLAMEPHTGPVTFKTKNGPIEKKLAPSKTLINFLDGMVVHSSMYRPDCAGDLRVMSDGVPYINSYRPNSVPGCDPKWREKDAWKVCQDHILNILGEAGWLVIAWIAYNVQNPGKKILWAPIIVGVQGDGKTTLFRMISAVMGRNNAGVVSPETMFSDFTGWAEGACVKVLEEIRVHGNSRHDAMNKLKPMITNDVVEVVRKGKDGKQVLNVTNYMALTNYMDALALDEGDRRWAVFKTRFETREQMLSEMDDAYWERLYTAIDQQPDVLRGWLLDESLTKDFNRVAGPDVSDHKLAMIEATRTPDQVDVEEAIAIGAFGVTDTLIATDCLNEAILRETAQRLNSSRLAKALDKAGWVRFPKVTKWRGKARRLWFKKGSGLGASTPAEITAILDTTEGANDL